MRTLILSPFLGSERERSADHFTVSPPSSVSRLLPAAAPWADGRAAARGPLLLPAVVLLTRRVRSCFFLAGRHPNKCGVDGRGHPKSRPPHARTGSHRTTRAPPALSTSLYFSSGPRARTAHIPMDDDLG